MKSLFGKYTLFLGHYVAISLIAGAISHGFFSETRSLLTAGIGIILFIIVELIQQQSSNKTQFNGWKQYAIHAGAGLFLGLGIGMVTGGLQHFVDSPLRSLWIIPVGYAVSFGLYIRSYQRDQVTKWLDVIKRSLVSGLIILGVSFATLRLLPTTLLQSHNHGSMIIDQISFLQLMIPHHQEAIDTSRILLSRTQHNSLKTLLQSIITTQQQEINMMQQRLHELYPQTADHHRDQYALMMRPISTNVSVEEHEKIWLEDMIVHHQGAIEMAAKFLTLPEKDPRIIQFAKDVIVVQSQEIDLMYQLLGTNQTVGGPSHKHH